ncbi:MAG: hypothetical protein P4L39_01260 [Humidesulfovibrio sp.]|nr:hypothetical protein [Humidesulfovibrio sp.]
MGGKKKKGTAFTLVIPAGEARVRKTFAPSTRVLEDVRRKKPRRHPDLSAETDDLSPL